jgi:hypothetical protein
MFIIEDGAAQVTDYQSIFTTQDGSAQLKISPYLILKMAQLR